MGCDYLTSVKAIEIAKNDWVNNVGIEEEKHKQPASKQVWVDVTSANNQIRYHNRAKYYLYIESVYDNLIKELNSGVIFEGKDNAAEFCAGYNKTFQEALDDNAAYYK